MSDSITNVAQSLTASGRAKDANGTILTKGHYFRCAALNPAGTACRVKVFDGTDNTGQLIADVVSSANGYTTVSPDYRIPVQTGIYAEISGAPTSVIVYYE